MKDNFWDISIYFDWDTDAIAEKKHQDHGTAGIFSSSGNPERKNNENMFSLEYWVECDSHRKEVPIGSMHGMFT